MTKPNDSKALNACKRCGFPTAEMDICNICTSKEPPTAKNEPSGEWRVGKIKIEPSGYSAQIETGTPIKVEILGPTRPDVELCASNLCDSFNGGKGFYGRMAAKLTGENNALRLANEKLQAEVASLKKGIRRLIETWDGLEMSASYEDEIRSVEKLIESKPTTEPKGQKEV